MSDFACGTIIDEQSASIRTYIIEPVFPLCDGEDAVVLTRKVHLIKEMQHLDRATLGEDPQVAAPVTDKLQVANGVIACPIGYLIVSGLGELIRPHVQGEGAHSCENDPFALPVDRAPDGIDVS